jgi:uncharacterized protein YcgI (DUF1989 family)
MSFTASQPDGSNDSLKSAISADGAPALEQSYRVPARCGVAVKVSEGQTIEVQNTHGTQVCDFWAFCQPGLDEFLSMAHTRTSLSSVFPKVGDKIVSNICDINRYKILGCKEYHDNCTDNLRMALMSIGLQAPSIPDPFNLWMNIPIAPNGSTTFEPTVSKPQDRVKLKALCDVIVVMSACPQDMNPINGIDCDPTELHFRVIN